MIDMKTDLSKIAVVIIADVNGKMMQRFSPNSYMIQGSVMTIRTEYDDQALPIENNKTIYSCPKCGNNNIGTNRVGDIIGSALVGKCNNCNHNFTISTC